jgi:putative membrane protein
MRWTCSLLLFASLMACNKQVDPVDAGTPEDGTPSAPPTNNPPGSMAEQDGGMAGAPGGVDTPDMAVDAAALTDAQIAHVLHTSNQAEVEDGREAAQKSTNATVKQFANQMVTDHGAADDKLKALATQKTMTPETNPLSEKMQKDHAEAKSRLASLTGAAFDKAYADHQVEMHQKTLDTIDNMLLPNTDDPELKAMITGMRPTIAAHLDHAKMMQQQLAGGGPALP